jgi:hypothetical protein
MPPIDAPTTCARLIPSASRRGGGVSRHVVEGIRRDRRPAGVALGHHGREVGHAELGQKGRAPDVAIVEPDDPEPAGYESLAERIRPAGQRRDEPMDHQDRRIAVAPEALIGDVDAVGADFWHGCASCVKT